MLAGKVALVAGSSRGAGRGIALALGSAGATVYVAGRTRRGGPPPDDGAPGTVDDTAEQVTARGGVGIAASADLSQEDQVRDLFARVEREHGRLDAVVNSVWAADCMPEWGRSADEMSPHLWQQTLMTFSAAWLVSVAAIRVMRRQRCGLIAHVTDNLYPDASEYRGNVLHDLGHEFLNRLIQDLGRETGAWGITTVGLNPGFMRTERVLMAMKSDEIKRQFRFDLSESPEYVGRAAAALAADPDVVRHNGKLLRVADLALEYRFTDTDGRFIPNFDPTAPPQPFPE